MAALTDDGSAVMQRSVEDGLVQIHGRRSQRKAELTAEAAEGLYDVAATVAAVKQHGATRVALQLPDWLLRDATMIHTLLRDRCEGVLFFVMADTLFAPCCVDEITAQHCNSDMVVKYGHSCMTATTRVPVHFVHPKPPSLTDLPSIAATFLEGKDARATVVGEPCMQAALEALKFDNVVVAGTELESSPFVISGKRIPETSDNLILVASDEGVLTQGYLWQEYQRAVGSGKELLVVSDTGVLEVVDQTCCAVYKTVQRRLRSRYFTMEKIKDAEVVAIVVVSLAIEGYAAAVQHMQKIIAESGKQSIVVYVGKPNVPKLANYEEVDLYCVIACPQSTWFDAKEYPKPVVTPIDIACALSEADNDTECNPLLTPQYYSLELSPVLRHYEGGAIMEHDVSLVTGKVRGGAEHALPALPEGEEGDEGGMVEYVKRELIAFEGSALVKRMHAREYQGLEARTGETEVQTEIAEGLHGIASGYASEPKVANN